MHFLLLPPAAAVGDLPQNVSGVLPESQPGAPELVEFALVDVAADEMNGQFPVKSAEDMILGAVEPALGGGPWKQKDAAGDGSMGAHKNLPTDDDSGRLTTWGADNISGAEPILAAVVEDIEPEGQHRRLGEAPEAEKKDILPRSGVAQQAQYQAAPDLVQGLDVPKISDHDGSGGYLRAEYGAVVAGPINGLVHRDGPSVGVATHALRADVEDIVLKRGQPFKPVGDQAVYSDQATPKTMLQPMAIPEHDGQFAGDIVKSADGVQTTTKSLMNKSFSAQPNPNVTLQTGLTPDAGLDVHYHRQVEIGAPENAEPHAKRDVGASGAVVVTATGRTPEQVQNAPHIDLTVPVAARQIRFEATPQRGAVRIGDNNVPDQLANRPLADGMVSVENVSDGGGKPRESDNSAPAVRVQEFGFAVAPKVQPPGADTYQVTATENQGGQVAPVTTGERAEQAHIVKPVWGGQSGGLSGEFPYAAPPDNVMEFGPAHRSQAPNPESVLPPLETVKQAPVAMVGSEGPAKFPQLATMVVRQLTEHAAGAVGQTVELRLNPVELGRVKMGLSGAEDLMVVTILAERPETLSLMRRHVDQLQQEFQRIGYSNVSFSFDTHSGAGQFGTGQPGAGQTGLGKAFGDTPRQDAGPPMAPDDETEVARMVGVETTLPGGLDIRI